MADLEVALYGRFRSGSIWQIKKKGGKNKDLYQLKLTWAAS